MSTDSNVECDHCGKKLLANFARCLRDAGYRVIQEDGHMLVSHRVLRKTTYGYE